MKLTLEELQNEVETSYQALELAVSDGRSVRLQPLVLLSKDKRTAYMRSATEFNEAQEQKDADADLEGLLLDLLARVADDPQLLREALGGRNLAILSTLYKKYSETTQGPEASSSPS